MRTYVGIRSLLAKEVDAECAAGTAESALVARNSLHEDPRLALGVVTREEGEKLLPRIDHRGEVGLREVRPPIEVNCWIDRPLLALLLEHGLGAACLQSVDLSLGFLIVVRVGRLRGLAQQLAVLALDRRKELIELVVAIGPEGDLAVEQVGEVGESGFEVSAKACGCGWNVVGEGGTFCKHCVAVALVCAGPGTDSKVSRRTRDGGDEVREYLFGLDRARLVDLVVEQAGRDESFRERLFVRAAAASGDAIDVRDRRRSLKKAFGGGRFIDYREAPGWAAGVHDALVELGDLLDAGYAPEVVDLVEYAHVRAEKAIQHVDDSDGWITDISHRLGDLHVRACAAAAFAPDALARRLVELELGSELDTFHRAALTYSQVLGAVGIDEYRRLIEPRFAALEPGDDWSHERFRVRNARIGVALAAGDPDELIAVKSNDLRVPDDFEEIASLLAECGRVDEAVSWCERGLTSHADRTWQLAPLRERLAQLHRDRDEADAAVDVFWAGFEQLPSLDSYRRLVREADQADDRERRQAAAFEYLNRAVDEAVRAGSDPHVEQMNATIIEVRLFEGDTDEAWRVASERGCHQRLWMQLARAREQSHPDDAIPIYEREVESLIEKKKDAGYRDAVKVMMHIDSLLARLERPDAFGDFVERVRTVHGRKTNLMRRLTAKGW